ncbi:LAETG motif-containing sortase-dependent surface protein [Streptomyces noursei]|uniref:LAETG motif-containing sortase-dependent surface protein n=1 Tax=Streptomyces noursei TaxID=1971 RepID=UPI0023B87676|nr:LAETG motif-containing sortase-dependent surface protein [Streptomyces noursei]
MHARIARGAAGSVAPAAALTAALAWAPTATAQSPQPASSSSTAAGETPEPEAGGVAITTKDPAGDALPGAAFLLLDSAGQQAGSGKTDAQDQLDLSGLAPGVSRLKETASGSTLHEVADDQDVIVTPGSTTQLTIIDPFKPAEILLKAQDSKTGKPLAGATVNIGLGGQTVLTLTTGPQGTATGNLRLTSRTAEVWAKQTKAPAGYEPSTAIKTLTATPGASTALTLTNATTATSTPDPTPHPTDEPTDTPSTPTATPTRDASTGPRPAPTDTGTPDADSSPTAAAADSDAATPKPPTGSLAHTGADATPWLLGGAAALLVVGVAAIIATRRHRPDHGSTEN